MDVVVSGQSGVETQFGLLDSIIDLFMIGAIFLLGIVFIGIVLFALFRKNTCIPKIKITIAALMMYCYLCVLFTNVVGIPTLSEFIRMLHLGEGLLHPNINLIPFSDGFSLSFILNIFLFIPFGFLCPFISKTFERAKTIFLIGLGLSAFIEFTQLFTLYRVSDINDLMTNVIGTMIGYLCFRLLAKLKFVKLFSNQQSGEKDCLAFLPVFIIMVTFVLGFFS